VRTHQKRLKKYDIHWRNIELLRQFTTPYGNIKSRWANRLSPSDQKKVKMAIKTARHNCAIPYYGRTLNPNKKNITNIED
jgi:ribosomal protein S18